MGMLVSLNFIILISEEQYMDIYPLEEKNKKNPDLKASLVHRILEGAIKKCSIN